MAQWPLRTAEVGSRWGGGPGGSGAVGWWVRAASWLPAAIGREGLWWAPHGGVGALAQSSLWVTPEWWQQRGEGLWCPVPQDCGLGKRGPLASQGTGWGWRLGRDLSLGALPGLAVAPPCLLTPSAPAQLPSQPVAAQCQPPMGHRQTSADHPPALHQCPLCPHSPLPPLLSLLALSPRRPPGPPHQTGLQGRNGQREEEDTEGWMPLQGKWQWFSQGCH